MKNFKRKNFIAVVIFMAMTFMLTMTACAGNENKHQNPYNLDVIEATSDFYVNDFANIFTAEQKEILMEKAVNLDEEYGGIQVVVTTVESLNSCVKSEINTLDIENVAYSMFLQYGIGKDDMGILILFSTTDRDVKIETGRQMQFYITDSISDEIFDTDGIMDYLGNDQFAEGLIALQNAVISRIKSEVPVDWSSTSEKMVVTSEKTAPVERAYTAPLKSEDNVISENAVEASNVNKVDGRWVIAFLFAVIFLIALIKVLVSIAKDFDKEKINAQKQLEEQKAEYEQTIQSITAKCDEQKEELAKQATVFEQKMQSERNQYREQIRQKDNQIKENLTENAKLQKEVNKLSDTLRRIKALHPNMDFEAEIHQMIEEEFKAKAQEIDAEILPCLTLPADKDRINTFAGALDKYDSASEQVRAYITADRKKLHELFKASVTLQEEYERAEKEKAERAKAQSVYNNICAIAGGITAGNYRTYETLKKVLDMYGTLTYSEQQYFPNKNMISQLKVFFKNAEEDYRNVEKAHDAENEVQRIISGIYIADEDDRDKLQRAMRIYKGMRMAEQAYFSAELLRKLEKFIRDAEDDHRRQEDRRRREADARRRREEEERRRRMMSSSSSSSRSHSSFGGHSGHGGRPSAGGSSRHF